MLSRMSSVVAVRPDSQPRLLWMRALPTRVSYSLQSVENKLTKEVTAVVLMGDPSHAADEFFNAGSSVNDGVSSPSQ